MKKQNTSKERSQFGLMKTKRFAPLFWTQFLGAFNDNVFKNALMILIAFEATQIKDGGSDMLINLAAGLFILPFFLFSATAGQIADKYEKSFLIRKIKLLEIVIMVCAAIGFYFNSFSILIVLLFLMGLQSTLFGPIKYSIIPVHLKAGEIVGGNALVETGTFLAILLGMIVGGKFVQIDRSFLIGAVVCLVAVSGWIASRYIPAAVSLSPDMKIKLNPLTQTWKSIQYARKVHSVFLSILAISWFWFLGMAYVTQLPNYTKKILHGSEDVYLLIMIIFTLGIALGSLLCEKLSDRKVELGLVPLGSIGLSIFGFDLFFAYTPTATEQLLGIQTFLQTPGSFRVIADLFLIGIFGGLYSVPLFAFIQKRTKPEYLARVFAANNILNAMFMVVSAIFA